jgi:hypothetical protein
MPHRKLHASLSRAALDTGESAWDATLTIAARLPILTAGLMNPTTSSMKEWNMAVNEKVSAAVEGAFAASMAWQTAMIRCAFRPPTPAGLAQDIVDVTNLAWSPARKAVKANARRLSPRKG